jgi:hypothetical protein
LVKKEKGGNMSSLEVLEQENYHESSNSIFNLTLESFEELQKFKVDLNGLFLLECYYEGTDPSKHVDNVLLGAWKQSLQRKGLLTNETLSSLTQIGKALIEAVKNSKKIASVIKVLDVKIKCSFDLWWEAFPRTDLFSYQGKEFTGSRGMRVKKEDCRKKFAQIMNEGEHTPEDMVRALEYEVLLRKQDSFKEKDNKLKYMHNSYTYLLQRDFENFIEISKVKKAEVPRISGTFDI